MTQEFFKGTTRALRIGMAGFVIAAIGVAVGFFSFYVEQRWLGIAALVLTGIGVLVGFAGILYGWIRDGKQAIKNSARGAKELRAKFQGK